LFSRNSPIFYRILMDLQQAHSKRLFHLNWKGFAPFLNQHHSSLLESLWLVSSRAGFHFVVFAYTWVGLFLVLI
jgi:hypothetical protein